MGLEREVWADDAVREANGVGAALDVGMMRNEYRSAAFNVTNACEGPVRQFDPAYYRLQPWQCLRAGATGSAFWSCCDGGGESSWCPYAAWRKKNNFTPVYIGPDNVITSKHWEAAREGVEDHQYLVMLRRVVCDLKQRGVDAALVREADQLAAALPDDVVKRLDQRAVLIAHREWTDKAPCRSAEEARLRALDMLVKLNQLAR